MKEYNKYVFLKNKFKVKYKGNKLNDLLAVYFISDSYNHMLIPKIFTKKIFKSFFYIESYKNLNQVLLHKGIILSQSKWNRKDYRELVELMGENMKDSLIFDYKYKRAISIRVDIMLMSFVQVFFQLKKSFSFRQLLFLASKVSEIKQKIIELNGYSKKIKGFIAFNSAVYDDAILSSVFNNEKIKTFSLQHGYYSIYKINIPLDIINYENLVAKQLLCWGQDTYNNMLSFGLKKDRLFILGNPKMNYSKNIDIARPKFNKCLVLLGRDIYHDSNIHLINMLTTISKTSNEEFVLKLHPTLRVKKLENAYIGKFEIFDENKTVHEIFKSYNFDLAISNNTSAYFDALINGILCFRFTKYENEDFGKSILSFSELENYYNLKKIINNKKTIEIKEIVMKILSNNFSNNFSKNINDLNNLILERSC